MTAINDEYEQEIIERVKALDDAYMEEMRERMEGKRKGQLELSDEQLFWAVTNKSREWEAQGDPNFLIALAIASPKDYRRYEKVWREVNYPMVEAIGNGNP